MRQTAIRRIRPSDSNILAASGEVGGKPRKGLTSDAEAYSNRSRATVRCLSIALRISLLTFRRAVSVLCSLLYADCNGSRRSLLSICSIS